MRASQARQGAEQKGQPMKQLKQYAKHILTTPPESATYEQCQQAWALMQACHLKPVWIDYLTYSQAISLLNTLHNLRAQRRNP